MKGPFRAGRNHQNLNALLIAETSPYEMNHVVEPRVAVAVAELPAEIQWIHIEGAKGGNPKADYAGPVL